MENIGPHNPVVGLIRTALPGHSSSLLSDCCSAVLSCILSDVSCTTLGGDNMFSLRLDKAFFNVFIGNSYIGTLSNRVDNRWSFTTDIPIHAQIQVEIDKALLLLNGSSV